MPNVVRLLLVLVCLSVTCISYGQRKLLRQADAYYKAKKYYDAIDIYTQVEPKKEKTLLKLGISQYHVGKYQEALVTLSSAYKSGSRDKKLYLYTGLTLHRLERYEEAAPFYKDYLSKSKNCTPFLLRELKKLAYAQKNAYVERSSYIENMGNNINSKYGEKRAIVSPRSDERLYFSSDRPGSSGGLRDEEGLSDEIYGSYAYDMYGAAMQSGSWRLTGVFEETLNGPKHDVLQGFNPDGSVLFFTSLDRQGKGHLKVDTFRVDEERSFLASVLDSPIHAGKGDSDVVMYGDSLLLFTSNSLGGYGGYDIFMLRRKKEGWSLPINMGPIINGPYNDKSPYLSKSGNVLYFASDRIEGYGGYDIFSATYGGESGKWTDPRNAGLPINSPANDTHFSISNDGRIAYITSDRKGTRGGSDIYRAIFKSPRLESYTIWDLPLFVLDQERIVLDTVETETFVESDEPSIVPKDSIKRIELYIKSLYYGIDDNALTNINQGLLDELASNMQVYPELNILLMGHAAGAELPEYSLYFSIKRVEKVRDYLVNKGISPDRITMYGWGNYFPRASGNTPVAEKINRRIDIRVYDPNEKFDIVYDQSKSSGVLDTRYEDYSKVLNGLSYTIQVQESDQMYINEILSKYRMVVERMPNQGLYTYGVTSFATYAAARKVKNVLLKSGYNNAAIVPYIQGHKLTPQSAATWVEKYKDLNDFLLYE